MERASESLVPLKYKNWGVFTSSKLLTGQKRNHREFFVLLLIIIIILIQIVLIIMVITNCYGGWLTCWREGKFRVGGKRRENKKKDND